MATQEFELAPEPPPVGVQEFEVTPPGWSDVAASTIQQPGLDFIQAGGGAMRAVGDVLPESLDKGLGSLLGTTSLSDLGAKVARTAKGASEDITPPGMTLPQQVISGGVTSALEMAPAMAAGAALPAVGIATAAAQQAGSRYAELRDAGFSPGRSALHAGFEGFAEALGEAVSLPVLLSPKPLLNKFTEFLAKDLFGEELTTVMEQGSAMLSDNPNMTWGQFLQGMEMTALVTPVAAGLQVGMSHGAQLARTAIQTPPPPPTPPVPPPPLLLPAPAKPAMTAEAAPEPPPGPAAPTPPSPDTPPAPPPQPEKPAPTGEDKPSGYPAWMREADAILTNPNTYGFVQSDISTPNTLIYTHPTSGARLAVSTDGGVPIFALETRDGGYKEFTSVHELVKFFETQDAGGPAPKQPAPAIGYVSMLEATPQQMAEQQQFDPEIYNGVASPNGVVHVGRTISGDFMVDGHLFRNAQEAIDHLAALTNIDIRTDFSALRTLYGESALSKLINDPSSWLDVSGDVNDYFGGYLQQISQGMEQKLQNIPSANLPAGFIEQRRGLGQTAMQGDQHGWYLDLNFKEHQVLPGETIDKRFGPTTLLSLAHPEMRVKSQFTPEMKRAMQVVEYLRRKYLPNHTVFILPISENAYTGSQRTVSGNVVRIRVGGLLASNRTNDISAAMKSVAHEFGHAVITEHLQKATPALQARLLLSWITYTREVKGDTTLLKYMIEHHFDERGMAQDAKVLTIDQVANQDPRWMNYLMTPSEYFADQAAGHFMLVDKVGETLPWYEHLLQRLKDLWALANVKFRLNQDFSKWLSSLAGPPEKLSGRGPRTAIDPPPTATTIKAKPPVKPVPIRDKGHAAALIEKAGLLMDALHRAGATKEEVDALSPTGQIKDLDWNAAIALADKYGIPRTAYNERYGPNSVDDTTAQREALWRMGENLSIDADLRREIGKNNEALRGWNWFLQKTMTAVQLRKRFGDTVPGVKKFVDTLETMFGYRSRWKELADNRIKQMKEVGHKERERVFNLLLEEDASGDFASTITRNATGQRIFTLKPEAIQKYKLTENGVKLYTSIRSDFDSALEELEFQAVAELERLYTPGPALTKAVAELRDGFNQMKARPYVPHTRFGDYTVTVREGGIIREFYQLESERDAKALEARLRRENASKAGVAVSRGIMTDQFKTLMGLPPQLIVAMKAQLGLNDEQIGKFEDMLKDMSNGASFVRRFKRRKNVAGWADDADMFPRAYADYMSRFANHVSRLRFNHVLSDSIGAVKAQALDDARLGANTTTLNQLTNWLNRLHDYVNNPGTEYTNIRAAATIWYLGLNVKSALVNSTSVPMVTVPYLSKRYGTPRAMASTIQAYKDIAKGYVRLEALSPDERAMLEQLRSQNVTDQSFASELAGIREGGRLSDQTALSKPAAAFFGLKYYGMWLFQKVEIVNREVTALAAYRLARVSPKLAQESAQGYDQKAFEFARQSVKDTQNENAQWNRGEFARGRKSILTMFMGYQQNIIYQMFGGDESWKRLLAVQFAMAGLMGIPFAHDLDELLKWFNREVFGSDINVEKAVRAYLKDTGVDADWMIRGASHNVFGLDLQGSLSQGRVIPGMDALAMQGSFPDRIANAASDVGGAGFSAIMDMLKAISSNDPDTIRRFGQAMPQFAQGVVQGAQMLQTGKAQDARGADIASVTPTEAGARMVGFQVADVTKERQKRFEQRDVAQYWLTRRAYVFAVYDLAAQSGDSAKLESAVEALREFNTEAPDAGLHITGKQLREAIRGRAMARARASADVGPNKSQAGLYSRVGEGYQ